MLASYRFLRMWMCPKRARRVHGGPPGVKHQAEGAVFEMMHLFFPEIKGPVNVPGNCVCLPPFFSQLMVKSWKSGRLKVSLEYGVDSIRLATD